MDFAQVAEQFRFAVRKLGTGNSRRDEYRAEVDRLGGTDGAGHRWRIDPGTGAWQVEGADGWAEATPPGMPRSRLDKAEARSDLSASHVWAWWLKFWGFVALALFLFAGTQAQGRQTFFDAGLQPLPGVLFLAIVSAWLARGEHAEAWTGTVREFREEFSYVKTRSGTERRRRRVARLEGPDGSSFEVPAMPGWEPGDRIEKRAGETMAWRLDL